MPERARYSKVRVGQEEMGYPHEIIILSVKKVHDVLKGNYLKRTKIMAQLVLNIIENSKIKSEIQINKKDDINLRILHTISKNSKFSISLFNEHQRKLNELLQQYKERKSSPAFNSLKEFVYESLFLHVILSEWKSKRLIKANSIKELLSIFSSDTQLNGLLRGLESLDKKNIFDNEVNEITTKIHGINEPILSEMAVYLTFKLAMKFTKHKNKFLFEHYFILKNTIQNLSGVIEHTRLDDTVLERLFVTSSILCFCGYKKAIRLPHEEKLNYFEHIISIPTIVSEFRNVFEKYATFNLKYFKIPLWFVGLINSIFILLSILNEIYLPAGLNLPIISVNLPFNIPLFATISLLLLIFISLHLYRLKGQISRELRRG